VEPIVSFVVPSYNYGRYVTEAVDSLLSQTLREIEVIVIDDASTDDTPAVLQRYRDDPRVTLIRHQTNAGHVRTYNEGLQMARGRYIGLLSADDMALNDDAVARQVACFEAHETAGFVYSAAQLIGEDGERESVLQPHAESYFQSGYAEFERLAWGNHVPASGTLVRRACHESLGWYAADLPHSCDWDLWLRLCTRFDVAYIAAPLYGYRLHPANMSHASIAPARAIDEQLATLTRNLALLPQSPAASHLHELARPLRRNALYTWVWIDLGYARARRAWAGLAAIARRQPRELLHRRYLSTVVRAGMLTCLRGSLYRRLYGGIPH
jgi:glycosyltransferase involved in cell wall biosynthesis